MSALPTPEETVKPAFQSIKLEIPTKETIEKELTAAHAKTLEGIETLRELDAAGDMHSKVAVAIFSNLFKKYDVRQREIGLRMQQLSDEIKGLQMELRYVQMSRAEVTMQLRNVLSNYKKMHEDEARWQEELKEIKGEELLQSPAPRKRPKPVKD